MDALALLGGEATFASLLQECELTMLSALTDLTRTFDVEFAAVNGEAGVRLRAHPFPEYER